MSETVFRKYMAVLDSLFYDYNTDYEEFREKGEKLLDEAIEHPEMVSGEFLALALIYENMLTYLEGVFRED